MIRVEVLVFDGCPSWHHAWCELGAALVEADADAVAHLRNVEGLAEQDLAGFGGTPTNLVDGRDVEGFESRPLWACRRYAGNEGRGWPSRAQLREALWSRAREVAHE